MPFKFLGGKNAKESVIPHVWDPLGSDVHPLLSSFMQTWQTQAPEFEVCSWPFWLRLQIGVVTCDWLKGYLKEWDSVTTTLS